jgi:hypothetical protein
MLCDINSNSAKWHTTNCICTIITEQFYIFVYSSSTRGPSVRHAQMCSSCLADMSGHKEIRWGVQTITIILILKKKLKCVWKEIQISEFYIKGAGVKKNCYLYNGSSVF